MSSVRMKKVRCQQCGVINLEKFVTFPYCAGCGALLPQLPETTTLPLWRRPLKPLLWVTTVSCAAAGLIAATTSFNSTPAEPGHIVIYAQVPRAAKVGQLLNIRLTVDTIETPTSRDQKLNEVKLRLTGNWLQKFKLIDLKPSPDEVTLGGSARYFHYHALAPNTPLQLTVRALKTGRHQFKAVMYAQQQYPGEYRTTINVGSTSKQTVISKQ